MAQRARMGHKRAFLERVISTFTQGADDRAYAKESWPIMTRLSQEAARLMGATPPARILDLACGTGSFAVAWSLSGFQVVGIDCTPAMIGVAKGMSKEKGASVEWLCEDMRQIQYSDEFEYVCLRDVIFSIFETEEEDLDLIRRISLALKPGGRCLFEVYNKEFAIQHGIEREFLYHADTDRFYKGGDPNDEGLSVRLYSHKQWRQMLADCGMPLVSIGNGWNWNRDPDPPPWRADFIVAEKVS